MLEHPKGWQDPTGNTLPIRGQSAGNPFPRRVDSPETRRDLQGFPWNDIVQPQMKVRGSMPKVEFLLPSLQAIVDAQLHSMREPLSRVQVPVLW